jgi:hypothetical protein
MKSKLFLVWKHAERHIKKTKGRTTVLYDWKGRVVGWLIQWGDKKS